MFFFKNGEEKEADFCPFGSIICTNSVHKDGKINYGCAFLALFESGQITEDRSLFYQCKKNLCNVKYFNTKYAIIYDFGISARLNSEVE